MQTDIEQRCQPYRFNIGDKVWLQAKQIKIHQQSSKLGPKQLGPFEVVEVRSDVDYKLALPPVLKVHDVFHVDRLSPYKGNKVNGLTPPPPDPVTVEGEEEYEVDHIRDSKVFGRTLKYLVRWTGYGEGEDTWEPAKNMSRPHIFYQFIWIYLDLFDRGFVSKSLSLDMIRFCHVTCHVIYKPFVQWHVTLGESCHSRTDICDWIDKPRA
jgi:hypothetical protein